ncbi:fla cluster protein FlaF [Salinigranum halophilum]|uniref:fla cluster protein FlaF n=1 Tax=Salinigranum halophilum TaxID=2565931 RepID=UPI0010A90629|nr:fla cluster protein FlaF [Salinigranum halophilum]
MGFGVSGATAIIFLGLFIAGGTLVTTTSATFEEVDEARDDRQEHLLDRRNTEIAVQSAVYNSTTGTLRLSVSNEGATTLSVNGTTVLVDNEYEPTTAAAVDGIATTDLWEPGETMTLNLSRPEPTRVKIVTEQGVADTSDVTVT